MDILVTGGQGFIGSHLVPALVQDGHSVDAPVFDLLSYDSVLHVVKMRRWDVVIHLAGLSHVPTCENDPSSAFRTNVCGTALLIEALKNACPVTKLVFSSTAQVYAAAEGAEISNGVVFDERRKIKPQNVYAQTKWDAELLLRDAFERSNLEVVIFRLFNHTHKSQNGDFYLPYLYSQLSKLKQGMKPGVDSVAEVPVGNCKVSRDIGGIDDLIQAFCHLFRTKAEMSGLEVFNICSGKAKNLSVLAEKLADCMGIKAKFVIDPARVRKNDPVSICGSHERYTAVTGWKPNVVSEDDLLRSFLKD